MLDTLTKRVRAGFSLAIITLVVIFGSLLLSKIEVLQAYTLPILVGYASGGVVLLLWGLRKTISSDVPVATSQERGDVESERPLAFLRTLAYWGWIIIISALPILGLCQLLMPPEQKVELPPRPRVAAKVAQPPSPAPVAAPVVKITFPDLKLTGLVCNGANSMAVINGSTIRVGRRVEDVTLVAVESWGVIVEMNGVKKVIPLGG